MYNPITPIRRLYAEPDDLAQREPDELSQSEHAELEALRPVKEALESLPRSRPDAALVDAVLARARFPEIRALYGEPAEEPLAPRAAQEARALAPLKEALDNLPPQRPTDEVIDAVVAHASYAEVRTLYEDGAPASLPSDTELRIAALAPVKAALDQLPRQRPDPAVIDRVVSMAVATQGVRTRRGDREAVRQDGAPRRRRRVGSLVATAGAVVLVVMATLLVRPGSEPESLAALEPRTETLDRAPATPEVESEARVEEPVQQERAQTSPRESAPSPSAAAPSLVDEPVAAATRPSPPPPPVPSHTRLDAPPVSAEPDVTLASMDFDAGDEALRLLYLRLESLRDEDLALDAPEVILGAPATEPRTASRGWMQVRIER